MTSVWRAKTTLGLVSLLALALVVGGCGGGGGNGGGGGVSSNGLLLAVSFVGFVTQPSGAGPNGAVPLPTVFIDQTLEFQFDAPIDDGIFGGFFSDANGPVQFLGVSASATTGGIPYFAYNNQSLAANSLQIRLNAPGGPLLASYIVGRHATKTDTLIIDPRVDSTNPLGLPFSAGFGLTSEYTYRIPSNNSIRMGGGTAAAPVGTDPLLLPIVLNPFSPIPSLSPVFRSGDSSGPDPVPPELLSIEAFGPTGPVAGTPTDPMPAENSFIQITFSKAIDPASVDLLNNMIFRNQDLVTVQEPNGRIVPGNFTIPMTTPNIAIFTPTPSWGPGVSMTQGYSIEVRVGNFGAAGVQQILGVPQGNPPQQLETINSMAAVFVTEPCPTCDGSVAIIEPFTDTMQRDGSFSAPFDDALWNDMSNPGTLSGTEISGTPLATFQGAPQNLGTRSQVNMPIGPGTTLPLTTTPFPGLFSPFDSMAANIGVNPNGGSHSMWLIEAVDLGSPIGSLELIEWGAVNNTIIQSTYPNYQCWAGMTTTTAPINCPTGVTGMTTIYSQNYDIAPPAQTADPNNLNPTGIPAGAGGVLVTPPSAYNAGPGFTSYFPFPTFTPPFDYVGSGTGSGNLLYEINIEPGMQVANVTRYRASNFVPVRRIIGQPLSSGVVVSSGSGCDMYDTRFTFVSIVSQAQSLFYDSGVMGSNTAVYSGMTLTPEPVNQPAGTSSIWQFEGAMALTSPSTPSGPTTGFLTYWSGTPSAGQYDPLVLEDPNDPNALQLTGNRYFRFNVELRNDNISNARQQYNSLIAAIVVSSGP